MIFLALLLSACASKPALESSEEVKKTPDEKSYYVIWRPENFDEENGIYLVTLHGHDGQATRDFEVFYPAVKEHGFALISLQWQLDSETYYLPHEIYKNLMLIFANENVKPGRVVLEGFSRGSANSYGVTLFDNLSHQYFALTIANSGHAGMDFPLYAEINGGKYGEDVFAGTRWIFYCGELDTSGDDNCEIIEESKNWVESLGGEVLLFMRDPNGDHGGMTINKENLENVLQLVEQELN